MFQNIQRQKEEAKNALFCDNILQIGRCFKEDRCRSRHVLKEADQANLNYTQGFVRVTITYVHSAVKYSVRVLEYNPDPRCRAPWIKCKTDFQKISNSMVAFFSNRNNRRLHGWIQIGDVVAYLEDGATCFQRARVIDVVERNPQNEPKLVLIFAMDIGYELKVSVSLLFELPEDLKNYPGQTDFLYLTNLQPVDLDIAWSVAARDIVEEAIASQDNQIEDQDEILGRLMFRFGNNFIVDNLRWVKRDKHTKKFMAYDMLLRSTILNSNVGLDNPEYSTKMIELFKQANLDYYTPKNLRSKIYDKVPPFWAHLPGDDIYAPVHITDVESPARFYVKLVEYEDALISLQKDIAAAPEDFQSCSLLLDLEVGDVCIYKHLSDSCDDENRWNRCLIMELQEEKATVLLVDYGEVCKNVSLDQLFEIPPRFVTKLPFQAIECRLAGRNASIVSRNEWCAEATDELNELIDQCDPHVFVKVHCSENDALRTGGRHYSVIVVNLGLEDDLENDGCVLNEKFSYGVRTIDDFGVDLDLLKKLNQKSTLPNHDDSPADDSDDDDDGDWNTPYVPPSKPTEPVENGHSCVDLEAVKNSQVFFGYIPFEDPEEMKMIEGPSSDVQPTSVVCPEDNPKLNSAQEIHQTGKVEPASVNTSVSAQNHNTNMDLRAPKARDDFPPLLPGFANKTPKVVWLQDKNTVTLRIMIPCLTRYELYVTDSYVDVL